MTIPLVQMLNCVEANSITLDKIYNLCILFCIKMGICLYGLPLHVTINCIKFDSAYDLNLPTSEKLKSEATRYWSYLVCCSYFVFRVNEHVIIGFMR